MSTLKRNSVKEFKLTPSKKISGANRNCFGETLREFRLQQKMTQGDAAKGLKISQAQWSGYEGGSSRPTLDMILDIARIFKVNPLALIGASLDKSRYDDPNDQLSFIEYKKIGDM